MRARAPLTIVPLEDRTAPASCEMQCIGPTLDDGYDAPLVGPESAAPDRGGSSEADGYPGPDFLGPDDPYSRVWW
jgi:hypothetical protein